MKSEAEKEAFRKLRETCLIKIEEGRRQFNDNSLPYVVRQEGLEKMSLNEDILRTATDFYHENR